MAGTAQAHLQPAVGSRAVPWYIWCAVIAVTSALLGTHWDIAWHRSIGRDSFWTPAHLLIQFCGVLAGITSGYVILSTTLRPHSPLRPESVTVWGCRGPLGTFIAAWGGVAMITSAPFDNWWHSAYGLDTKVLSPPHVLLATGLLAVELGAVVLIQARLNRAEGALQKRLDRLFLYTAGMILSMMYIMSVEYLFTIWMHSALFYRAAALAFPAVLAGAARASRYRWASTSVAAVYSALQLAMLWILPLAPAEPKLGPVYQNITHLIPMQFPLLLIVPAFLLDLLWTRLDSRNRWFAAAVAGAAFVVSFVAVQWPFANFLMSSAARNWFFGTHYFDYNLPATSHSARYEFVYPESTAGQFWAGMAVALACGIVTTRLGLAWGDWMRRVRR